MRTHIRRLTGLATVLLVSSAGLPAVAAANSSEDAITARATCHGKRATIVGNDRDNRLIGTRHRDVIVARGGDDRIHGRGGRDLICAGGGRDLLRGDKGNDYLAGGTGYDLVDYGSATRGVTVRLHRGNATGQGHDRLVNIAAVIGSRHNDTLFGGEADNRLSGEGGRDHLYGAGGTDHLTGDGGNDALYDLRGANNALVGDEGLDFLTIAPQEGDVVFGGPGHDSVGFVTDAGVNVDLADGTVRYPHTATVLSIETVVGTLATDTLYGSAQDETFIAGAGDDIIDGDLGNDYADGGDGYDSCYLVEYAYNCEY